MHDLSKFMPPPSNRGDKYDMAYWTICDKEFSEDDICVATKDGLPTSTQYEIEDKDKDYHSLIHKEWCDLHNILEEKDDLKITVAQIKILAAQKDVPVDSESYAITRVTLKNKARTGVLTDLNKNVKNNPKHKVSQRYCVLCNKSVMPE